MEIYTKIRMLCAIENISMSELAHKIGTSPQNLSAKIKRESLTVADFREIADALGMDFQYYFVRKNGDKI